MNSLIPWMLIELAPTGEVCPKGVPLNDLGVVIIRNSVDYLVRPATEVAVDRDNGFQPGPWLDPTDPPVEFLFLLTVAYAGRVDLSLTRWESV